MRHKYIIGNWKMNGGVHQIIQLLENINQYLIIKNNKTIVLCPPSLYLFSLVEKISNTRIAIGSQDISSSKGNFGAFTGEISAEMLLNNNINFSLVGHSERRINFNESNFKIVQKIQYLLSKLITPIWCIGEFFDIRNSQQELRFIKWQINSIIDIIGIDFLKNIIIAYEPVWAIGTGKIASPDDIQKTHCYIRNVISKKNLNIANNISILYGGSVKSENMLEISSLQDVDGVLVGGASLNALEFCKIYNTMV